jgi:hypothetical protein
LIVKILCVDHFKALYDIFFQNLTHFHCVG